MSRGARRTMVAVLAWLIPAAATVAPAAAAGAAEAGRVAAPLRVRNLSPATQLFGLPRALGGRSDAGASELTLLVEHANNFSAAAADGTAAVFDGSTTVTSLGLRRAVGGRWEWGVEVPYVHHGGGFTDGFIEEFHDLFGFPDGGREAVPRNRLDYRLISGSETVLALDAATGGVGDLRGWLGYRLHHGPGREVMMRAMAKAPSGGVADLSGSGGTDLSLALELVDARSLAAMGVSVTLLGGVTVLGGDELPIATEEDLVWSGHLGVHYPLTRRLTLRAQLDGHSDVIDTGIRQLAGGALQGTLGGSLALGAATWLDVGVIEDLTGSSAPDVVFLLTLGSRL